MCNGNDSVGTVKIIGNPAGIDNLQEGYVDSRTVRSMFGMTPNVLWNRRKKGLFPDPDLVLSRGVHLWKKSTLDNWAASHQFKREVQ